MYSLAATVYIKMKKPNAAIRDANAALEVCLSLLELFSHYHLLVPGSSKMITWSLCNLMHVKLHGLYSSYD